MYYFCIVSHYLNVPFPEFRLRAWKALGVKHRASIEFSYAWSMPLPGRSMWWWLGLALVLLFCYKDASLTSPGDLTSTQVPRTLCSSGIGFVTLWSSPTPVFFVLFRQNQLLAKGLLFVEEKIKLCEGKYQAALIWPSVTQPLMFWQLKCFCPKSGRLQVSDSPCPFLLQLGSNTMVGVSHLWQCMSEPCVLRNSVFWEMNWNWGGFFGGLVTGGFAWMCAGSLLWGDKLYWRFCHAIPSGLIHAVSCWPL